jgi:hypothetical protein
VHINPESTHFIFNKCPINTHDGAEFSTITQTKRSTMCWENSLSYHSTPAIECWQKRLIHTGSTTFYTLTEHPSTYSQNSVLITVRTAVYICKSTTVFQIYCQNSLLHYGSNKSDVEIVTIERKLTEFIIVVFAPFFFCLICLNLLGKQFLIHVTSGKYNLCWHVRFFVITVTL